MENYDYDRYGYIINHLPGDNVAATYNRCIAAGKTCKTSQEDLERLVREYEAALRAAGLPANTQHVW